MSDLFINLVKNDFKIKFSEKNFLVRKYKKKILIIISLIKLNFVIIMLFLLIETIFFFKMLMNTLIKEDNHVFLF